MVDWPKVRLGEVAEVVAGQSPPGAQIVESKAAVPFHQGVRDFGARFPTSRTFCNNPPRVAEQGDVLISVRAPVGRINIAPEKLGIGRGLMAIRGGSRLDTGYLSYLLESMANEWGSHESSGSVFSNLGKSQLAKVEIPLPPLPEQRAIAEVLGALDDKIESNRRVVQLAEALCDSMLVSAATSRTALKSVAAVVMGSSPPGSTYNEMGEGLPFYQGVRDFGSRFPSVRIWCSQPVREAAKGDLLVSVRAPVGRLNLAAERCCIGRGLSGVRSAHPSVLHYSLRQAGSAWAPYEQEGTVFGAIKRSALENVEILWPEEDRLATLEAELSTIDARINLAATEIQTLTFLRDALLPELLSGRLRVPEAVELAEAAL